MNSVKTNKHMLKILSALGSHTILVFFTRNVMATLQWERL